MRKWLIPIVAALQLVSGVAVPQVKQGAGAGQTRFSFGSDAVVQKPVAIPDEILPVLGQDDFGEMGSNMRRLNR